LNVRTKLGQFLNFCRRRKWIEANPTESIKVRVPSSDVVILTPAKAEELLRAAEKSAWASVIVPYAAIGFFGGLRPGEAEQLRWELVRFDTREIEVQRPTSKGRETRFVPLEDALRHWLEPYRKEEGPLIEANFRQQWESARIEAGYSLRGEPGIPWPENVHRHCYGTSWLAIHGDRKRLAEQMGNSVQVIKALPSSNSAR
jgi:integrase